MMRAGGQVVPVDGIARWVAPLHVTQKPDGGLRSVVDLRGRNAGIDVKSCPFPFDRRWAPWTAGTCGLCRRWTCIARFGRCRRRRSRSTSLRSRSRRSCTSTPWYRSALHG